MTTSQRVYVPQWQAEHRTTKFPFADGASLVNDEGLFLPEGLFVDANFYPPGGGSEPYLSTVDVASGHVRLVIGDDASEERCWAEFDLESAPAAVLSFQDEVGRTVGVMVPGEVGFSIFASWPEGTHAFSPIHTALAATCWIPTPERGLRGILLDDGTLLAGDVWLVGERGVVLTPETVVETNAYGEREVHEVIRIDIVGDPLFPQRDCGDRSQVPRLLRKMTVVTRSGSTEIYPFRGQLTLTTWPRYRTRPALRLQPAAAGLVVELASAANFFPFIV